MTIQEITQELATSKFGKELSEIAIGESSATGTLETALGDVEVEIIFDGRLLTSEDFKTKTYIAEQIVNRIYQRIIQLATE